MRSRIGCVLVVVGLVFTGREGRANGRYPAAGQAIVAPANEGHLYLRTTFGLLISKDAGGSWDWICESAFGYAGSGDPTLGVTANESVLVATPNGLWVSPDGCSWRAQLAGHDVTDLVVRPDDPTMALAVISDYAGTDGGASVFSSRVYATGDEGATWTALGDSVTPPALVATIEVAKADPTRIYLTALAGSKALSIVSTVAGASWAAHEVPLVAGELGAYLAAVDPANAERVYLRTLGNDDGVARGRLLVSDDGAASFREVLAGGAQLGFALSPDGGEVFAGGLWPSDGLRAASSGALVFAPRASLSVSCLTARGESLYACSDALVTFPFGASTDDGATFAARLDFRKIRGPLACPSGSETATCAAQWPALESQLGIAPSDAGASSATEAGAWPVDAAIDAEASPIRGEPVTGAARSSCACEDAGVPAPTSHAALLAGAAVAVSASARRRRGPSRRS